MKIVVIGGTGLIGSKLVEKLRRAGHEPLAASPQSGVDTYTGTDSSRRSRGHRSSSTYRTRRPGTTQRCSTSSRPLLATPSLSKPRLAWSTEGDTVHLPPVLVQPEAADDVAAALAEVAPGEPVNGIVELAGPEQFRLDELARRVLEAKNDPRPVTADVHARYFGAELDERSLIPGENARIAPTRFEDWLNRSARQTNP